MPPVRKNKKKPKESDAKASEQLRNWLTKDKKAQCTPPVSFKLFSKTVENLEEIAFNIQCNEIDATGKTLDECAQWYYHSFYSEPSIRKKYEFELRPCPLAVKEKLLQLPSDAVDKEATADERLRTEYEMEVTHPKYGRFLFPVSFAKFEQHIDKENLIPYLVRKESKDPSQHSAMLANNTLCQKFLLKYYHTFYMRPNRRKLNKFNFKGVPAALETQFLKPAEPLDELAKKNVPRIADQAVSAAETGTAVASTTSTNSVSKIVSFCVFEKHIKNIYDIVWRLKLSHPKFAYKGFEDCAYAYYLAFYLTPEIRDRYAYEIAPCTDAMRDQILAIPSKDEAHALQLLNPDHDLPESQEPDLQMNVDSAPIEIADEPANECVEASTEVCVVIEPQEQPAPMSCMESAGVAEITINECELDVKKYIRKSGWFKFPVSFTSFKHCINYDELIKPLLMTITQDESQLIAMMSSPQCLTVFLRYYHTFYVYPQHRKLYNYRFINVSEELLQKLLEIAQPLDQTAEELMANAAKDIEGADKVPNTEQILSTEVCEVIESQEQPSPMSCKEDRGKYEKSFCIEQTDKPLNALPVGYMLFKRYIKNLDEIVQQMLSCEEYKWKTEQECYLEYYKAFYTAPQIRDKFEYELKPCPAKIRKKLLSLPAAVPEIDPEPDPHLKEAVSAETDLGKAESKSAVDVNCNNREEAIVLSERIIITARGVTYEYPVSQQTFRRYINYDTVKLELAKHFYKNPQKVNQMLNDEQSNLVLLNKYYHSFYTNQRVRNKFNYNFNAAPAELQAKLIQFAVIIKKDAEPTLSLLPLPPSKPFPSPSSSTLMLPPQNNAIENDVALPAVKIVPKQVAVVPSQRTLDIKYPISLQMFLNILELNEVVDQMRQEPQYACMAIKECKNLFYEAFYRTPEIRQKYNWKMKPCPSLIRSKLLQIPNVSSSEASAKNEKATSDATLFRGSKAELSRMEQLEIARHTFRDLNTYIAQRKLSPKQSALVEKLFGGTKNSAHAIKPTQMISSASTVAKTVHSITKSNSKAVSQLAATPARTVAAPCESKSTKITTDASTVTKAVETTRSSTVTTATSLPAATSTRTVDTTATSKSTSTQAGSGSKPTQMTSSACNEARTVNSTTTSRSITGTKAVLQPAPASTRTVVAPCGSKSTKITTDASTATKAVEKTRSSTVTTATSLPAATSTRTVDTTATSKSTSTQAGSGSKPTQMTSSACNEARTVNITTTRRSSTGTKAVLQPAATSTRTVAAPCGSKSTKITTDASTVTKAVETTRSSTVTTATSLPAATSKTVDTTTTSKSTYSTEAATGNKGDRIITPRTGKAATAITNQTVGTTDTTCLAITQTSETAKVSTSVENTAVTTTTTTSSTEPITSNVSTAMTTTNFYAKISQEHNLKFLLCTSHGVQKTIWHIFSQLSYREFQTYTNIHEGASFYKDNSLLYPCYHHVVFGGNWPIDFYVKLATLRQLLHSKGVNLNELDLTQLSPKMLHWEELIKFSNFEEIVIKDYQSRTGEKVEDVPHLYSEVKQFYAMCWTHNKWIRQVPKINSGELVPSDDCNDTVVVPPPAMSFCMVEDIEDTSQDAAENQQVLPDPNACAVNMSDSDCPATQLNTFHNQSNFVDIDNVYPASQALDSTNDPLSQSGRADALEPVQIKEEPVKFLSKMRFTVDSNDSEQFNCELVPTEDEVINLADDTDNLAANLTGFDIPKTNENGDVLPPSSDSLDKLISEMGRIHDEFNLGSQQLSLAPSPQQLQVPATSAEASHHLPLVETVPKLETIEEEFSEEVLIVEDPIVEELIEERTIEELPIKKPRLMTDNVPISEPTAEDPAPVRTVVSKRQLPATTQDSRKKPRLMSDNVPQIRHEFRALPLAAMVRIEEDGLAGMLRSHTTDAQPHQESSTRSSPEQQLQDKAMTASQALSTDNTLMESSQLQHLLDAPFVSLRKVNVKDVIKVTVSDKNQAPVLHAYTVFHKLQRFMYFKSLTTAQISKYHINSLSVGSPYQQALICANGQLCNVYGPLIEILFPQCTPSLLSDLHYLLWTVDEFSYNVSRFWRMDSTEDLPIRVLYTFMRLATPFSYFRLQFENETREWAACSQIGDYETIRRKPSCDMRSTIRPEILERMKQIKCLYHKQ